MGRITDGLAASSPACYRKRFCTKTRAFLTVDKLFE